MQRRRESSCHVNGATHDHVLVKRNAATRGPSFFLATEYCYACSAIYALPLTNKIIMAPSLKTTTTADTANTIAANEGVPLLTYAPTPGLRN